MERVLPCSEFRMISQKKRKKQVIIDLARDVILGPLSPSRTCRPTLFQIGLGSRLVFLNQIIG